MKLSGTLILSLYNLATFYIQIWVGAKTEEVVLRGIFMNNFISHHKILFAFIYVAMPVLLGWIGYILIESPKKEAFDTDAISMSASTALYQLPRVKLSMSSGIGGKGMMKLDIGIEVNRDELKRVQDYEPRILEHIFFYMRKQDYAKLREPDSARWIRQGLEDEIDHSAVPIHVANVYVNRMVFE